MPGVAWLSVAPVRGTALSDRNEIRLEPFGVAENRRFYLVDQAGRRFTQTRCGDLTRIRAAYDPDSERLTFRFEDGTVVDGDVELGDPIETEFFGGRRVTGRVVPGAWADATSAFVGEPVRLVQLDSPGQAHPPEHAVSLVSEATLDELAGHAGVPRIDPRRFRMLVGLDGCTAREEDGWLGRRVRLGEAVVDLVDGDPRCKVTTRNPDSGEVDLDTLRVLKAYRGDVLLGVLGRVVEPGRVRVGDPVEPI